MDKYLILINKLQNELDNLLNEKEKLKNEIRNLEVQSSNLKSRIYVDEKYIECNKTNLEIINKTEEKYSKYMKISLMIVFFLSLIINIIINNISSISLLSTIIDSLVSSALFTTVVGGAEKCIVSVKKEHLNKYDRLNFNNDINNLSLNIKQNRSELEKVNIKLCQLRMDLQKKDIFQGELEQYLKKYKSKRNEILNEILENMIDQEIEKDASLDVPSFQLVMKKINSDNIRIKDEIGLN